MLACGGKMALADAHFVGRAGELGALDHALSELDRGVSVAIELVGEPGIGKTRLLRELDRLAVYGRAGGLQIYELLGMAGEFSGTLDWVKSYEAGLAAWRAGDFTAAIGAFEKALECRPDDAPSSVMIERCQAQRDNPMAMDWDGTTIARTK